MKQKRIRTADTNRTGSTQTTDSTLPVDSSSVNHKKVPHISNAHAVYPAGLSGIFFVVKRHIKLRLHTDSQVTLFLWNMLVRFHLLTHFGQKIKDFKSEYDTKYFVDLYFFVVCKQLKFIYLLPVKPFVSLFMLMQDILKMLFKFSAQIHYYCLSYNILLILGMFLSLLTGVHSLCCGVLLFLFALYACLWINLQKLLGLSLNQLTFSIWNTFY